MSKLSWIKADYKFPTKIRRYYVPIDWLLTKVASLKDETVKVPTKWDEESFGAFLQNVFEFLKTANISRKVTESIPVDSQLQAGGVDGRVGCVYLDISSVEFSSITVGEKIPERLI